MTEADILKLVPGDVIEATFPVHSRRWRRMEFVRYRPDYGLVVVRKYPALPGHRRPRMTRPRSEVRSLLDTTTANVFADWLEEKGFAEAAEVLRKAFPIVDFKGNGGPGGGHGGGKV